MIFINYLHSLHFKKSIIKSVKKLHKFTLIVKINDLERKWKNYFIKLGIYVYLSKCWWLLILLVKLTLCRGSLHWWCWLALSKGSLHWWCWIALSRLLVSLVIINRLTSSVVRLPRTVISLSVRLVIWLCCWISLLSKSLWRSIPTDWTSWQRLIGRRWSVYNDCCNPILRSSSCLLSNNSRILIYQDDSSSCFYSANTPNQAEKENKRTNDWTTYSSTVWRITSCLYTTWAVSTITNVFVWSIIRRTIGYFFTATITRWWAIIVIITILIITC